MGQSDPLYFVLSQYNTKAAPATERDRDEFLVFSCCFHCNYAFLLWFLSSSRFQQIQTDTKRVSVVPLSVRPDNCDTRLLSSLSVSVCLSVCVRLCLLLSIFPYATCGVDNKLSLPQKAGLQSCFNRKK